ncbi:hypothetical protein H9L39_14767 [Fusarium oxysporum f. sp. albedinis]|nr:hypothetical protein H9L39_14767 [Fusarium oxysporum f. sp. albedinis]
MLNPQAQTDRLVCLTENVIEEKKKKFRGIVKVPIEDLVFAPDFTPWDYNISAAKVSRLERIFKNEGCNRSEPSNFILGTISEHILSEALDLSKLTTADLQSRKDPPMLYLPRFQYIRCANGRSRANALSATPQLGSWWTVELYTDLSAEAFDIITENYMNEGEIIRYMEFILELWVELMGSKEALDYVDPEDVREFQLRVPGVSQLDFHHLSTLVTSGNAFKRMTDGDLRRELVVRMKSIKYLIPSLHTLQKDFKYLRPCTDTIIRLFAHNRNPYVTAQSLAFDAFSSKTLLGPDVVFFEKLKCLYLFIMGDMVGITGEWPLLEVGEMPHECVRLPRSWYRLAHEARRLGFHSDEITRLVSEDPDEQVALRALREARPDSISEYSPSQLQGIVRTIVANFGEARDHITGKPSSEFTTTGVGEPISRRCGRQYSGAYARDRWNFDLAGFSDPTPESMDITSLFVRKSVFHAFWRIEEKPNVPTPEPEDEPMLPPQTESLSSENELMYSQGMPVHAEAQDQPILDWNNSYEHNRMRRRVEIRHRKKKKQKRAVRQASMRQRLQTAKQPMISPATQPVARQLAVQQQPTIQQQLIPYENTTSEISMAEDWGAVISTPTLDLIRPLAQTSEMTVLEFIEDDLNGGSWKEHKCHRESISEFIQHLKGHFKRDVEFYHQHEPRTIAEHELPRHDAICIAPKNVMFEERHFPAEEQL